MDLALKITRPASLSREEHLALIERADALGYHSVWLGERWGQDPFVALAEVALRTHRIGLGLGVVNVYSRTPGAIAQAAATLDVVSRGRVLLGLGSSGVAVIEGFHGLPFRRPARRTREYLEVLRLLLRGQRVDYEGETVRVRGFALELPLVRDGIPLYVAGLGPRNLDVAGELADGWLPAFLGPGDPAGQMARVRASARRAGRDPAAVVVAPEIYVCVTSDPLATRELTRRSLARTLSGRGAFYGQQARRTGFAEEMEALERLWRGGRRDEAPRAVSDAMLDAFAIIGDAETCRARLRDLHARGWDLPIVRFPRGTSRQVIVETIEALAPGG